MTAPELIANLRAMNLLSADPRELFLYLAANVHQCRLSDGQRLNDLTDFESFLIELAQASKPKALDLTCPHCGHIHQSGEKECGEPVGGGRVCRCG